LDIPKSTFYDWYARYREKGFEGLKPGIDPERRQWNQIPEHEREEVVKEALEQPDKSPGELAFHITDTREWSISESNVYLGRDQEIPERRKNIKRKTLIKRKVNFILNK
jgi:transposase